MCVLYVILLQRYSPAYIKHSRLYCRQKRSTSPQKSSWCIVTSWSNCHLNARKYLNPLGTWLTSSQLPNHCYCNFKQYPVSVSPNVQQKKPYQLAPTNFHLQQPPPPRRQWWFPLRNSRWRMVLFKPGAVKRGLRILQLQRPERRAEVLGGQPTWFLEMNLWVSWFQFKISFF